MNKKERLVAAIENGTVIDHRPAEKTFQVASLLGLLELRSIVTIGNNYASNKVGKKGTPDELRGIVKCNNPKCITNNEPMQTIFHVVDKSNGILKCHYCDKEQDINKVELA